MTGELQSTTTATVVAPTTTTPGRLHETQPLASPRLGPSPEGREQHGQSTLRDAECVLASTTSAGSEGAEGPILRLAPRQGLSGSSTFSGTSLGNFDGQICSGGGLNRIGREAAASAVSHWLLIIPSSFTSCRVKPMLICHF
ncbi:unnamed protein product [Protopolystoma xenopodis]|uniref:Uncharacterized protein n=1 Tax=Protopolystoma xenopodis TaxID=117903 RepID=A0A448WLL7_9PLAT|nr:unnamed protein product [Protopolystoma xenopodis]